MFSKNRKMYLTLYFTIAVVLILSMMASAYVMKAVAMGVLR